MNKKASRTCCCLQKEEQDARVRWAMQDDCVQLQPLADEKLLISTDTLVAGVHWPTTCLSPDHIAYRALYTAISDLAAMGASPLGCLLNLSLPAPLKCWIPPFALGLRAALASTHCQLLGGDLTKSDTAVISVTVIGTLAKAQQALTRSGAQVGDHVFVSGTLGLAQLGLRLWQQTIDTSPLMSSQIAQAKRAFFAPTPQLALGVALLGIANAAIDISDGLLGDAAHISAASGVVLQIDKHKIPLDPLCKQCGLSPLVALMGDDYQLCFTASPENLPKLQALSQKHPITCIGRVLERQDHALPCLLDEDNNRITPTGYQHF